MPVKMIPGRDGTFSLFPIACLADSLRIGEVRNPDGSAHPTISVAYPPDITRTVLRIVREMDKRGILPETYFFKEAEGLSYIAVIFRVVPVTPRFVKSLLEKRERAQVGKIKIAEDAELYTTGEGILPEEEMNTFVRRVEETGSFRLQLVRPLKRMRTSNVLWSRELHELKERFPYEKWEHSPPRLH